MEKEIITAIIAGVATVAAAGLAVFKRKEKEPKTDDFLPKPLSSFEIYKKYVGFYECYHLSTAEKPVIVLSSSEIKINESGELEVLLNSHKYKYKYKGICKGLEGNLYINLEGVGHKEHLQFILNEALTPSFDLLVGVFSSVTEKRYPAAGKMLWLKVANETISKDIDFDDVPNKIKKFLLVEGNPIKVSPPDEPYLKDLPD